MNEPFATSAPAVAPGGPVDGSLVLRHALQLGLSIRRFPGQLLIVSSPSAPNRATSFVHSVGASTGISTATFVLQKRFRRALLEMASVPIPKGATFAFRSLRAPARFAGRVGYPVIVKEVFGENPALQVRDIYDSDSLAAAAATIRAHLPTSGVTRPSSYAQSINLSSAEEVDGRLLKAGRSRFLIEKQLEGPCYRCYVVGGTTIATIRSTGVGFVTSSGPSSVERVAEAAVAAISGLENATVDLVVPADGRTAVVEVCERMIIREGDGNVREITDRVVDALLSFELDRAAVEVPDRTFDGTTTLQVGGLDTDRHGLEEALRGVQGTVVRVLSADQTAGTARLSLSGEAEDVAATIEWLCESGLVAYARSDPR